jgi:hypothetical protein
MCSGEWRAVIVPLAILAAVGIETWAQRRTNRWGWHEHDRRRNSKRRILLRQRKKRNPGRPLFRPAAEITLIGLMRTRHQMQSYYRPLMGMLPHTHLRPFMGHDRRR